MRRLAITGLCAIALLSGCSAPPQPKVAGETNIGLPCKGDKVETGTWHVDKIKQTVVFHTDGRCKFTDLKFVDFVGTDPPGPPGFKRHTVTFPSPTVSYDYDGSQIPDSGYYFRYENDYREDGGGGGIIKN